MYWNCVNNSCYRFAQEFGYAGSVIKMSSHFYKKLEEEMWGVQWWFLVKNNSVRGCKIVIDDSVELIVLVGRHGDELVVNNLNITKFI